MATSKLSTTGTLLYHEDSQPTTLYESSVVLSEPLNGPRVGQSLTEEAISRTQSQWQWFSNAREEFPALGTLAYLPYEIRQLILGKALASPHITNADGGWEFDHRLGSPLNVSAYFFGENGRSMIGQGASGLRQVSSAMKAEFEDVLLCQRTFRFNDPDSLEAFIERLTDSQKNRVLSIAIGVCILHQMDGWLNALTKLPSKLRCLEFHIYTMVNDYFQPDSLSTLRKMMTIAACHAPDAARSICGAGQEPLNRECRDLANEVYQLYPTRSISRNV